MKLYPVVSSPLDLIGYPLQQGMARQIIDVAL